MKVRFYVVSLVVIIGLILSLQGIVLAESYTLTELQKLAQTNSTDVENKLKEIEDLKLDLSILNSNYRIKLGLSTEPLSISPDLRTDEIQYDSNGSLNGSVKFPFGLEVSSGVTVKDILDGEHRDTDYSFTVKYPIYPGIKTDSTSIQVTNKLRDIEKAEWNLHDKRVEAEIQVWNKFYTTLVNQKRMELAKESLEQSLQDLELAKDLQARDDIGQKEFLDKEISYRSSQVSYEKSLLTFQDSLQELLTYSGVKFAADLNNLSLTGSFEDISELQLVSPENLPESDSLFGKALENSTTLQELNLNLLMAKEELERMSYNQKPEINSQFDVRSGSEEFSDEYKWTISLSASYQLTDGGETKLEIEKQEKTVADLTSSLEEAKLTVKDQLESILSNLRIAYMEVQTAELEYSKAELDQNLLELQYNQGLISEIELFSGERSLQGKELDLISRRINYQVSYWEFEQFVNGELGENGVKL